MMPLSETKSPNHVAEAELLRPILRLFPNPPISDADAIAAIKRYQQENPTNLKSLWLDDSLVRAVAGGPVANVSGMRLYYVRYASGPAIDSYAVIVALTQNTAAGVHTDKPGLYFDYGQPCPPGCNGGLSY